MEAVDSSLGWSVGVGGPVAAAVIVALMTWVLRLLGERRRLRDTEHQALVKNVDDLAQAVKQITYALGGNPATPFASERTGLVASVAELSMSVKALGETVEELRVKTVDHEKRLTTLANRRERS